MSSWHVVRAGLAAALASCSSPTSHPIAAMPWLYGFAPAVASDAELEGNRVDDADLSRYGGVAVRARLRGEASDTVIASIYGGVAVVDASGHVTARAHGLDPVGTADDIEGLAVGDASIGGPVIAVARTLGGHRTSTTSLTLYQPGDERSLAELLDAPVVERTGDAVETGAVVLLPGLLVYRAPEGGLSLWWFDRDTRRYVRELELVPRNGDVERV